MHNIFHWILALPFFVTVPAYLALGCLVGIVLKYWFLRHRWTKHQISVPLSNLPVGADCWCEKANVGAFVHAGYMSSLVLWPLVLAITAVVFVLRALIIAISVPFQAYGKLLDLVPAPGPEVQDQGAQGPQGYIGIRGCGEPAAKPPVHRFPCTCLVCGGHPETVPPVSPVDPNARIDALLKKSEEVLREVDGHGDYSKETP